MIRTLDTSMLNISVPTEQLVTFAAQYGIKAIGVPGGFFADDQRAQELSDLIHGSGLRWGLLPLPADFYHWDLDDAAFSQALTELARRARLAEKHGIRHAYNHVWSSGPREYAENFEWHVRRVQAVSGILNDHGVHYGLEFLGPHELRSWQKHEFVHSLAGVLAIADAAGNNTGIAFDTFHWYCSGNGCRDDLMLMLGHIDRLVAMHINDAVAGVPYDMQKDMQRRLPMETGVIDSRSIFRLFSERGSDALYMIEPFEPGRSLFNAMGAQEAVQKAAQIFEQIEN